MKNLLQLLLLFVSSNFIGQVKAPETDFVLQYGKVFWEHSYTFEGKTATELADMIEARFAVGLNQSNFFKSEKLVSFNVKDDKPNIKKYGAKETKTSIIAQLYMKYAVKIDIEDGKYKVTIKEIFMDNHDATERKSGDFSKFACNTSNLTFKDSDALKQGMSYVNRHFIEKFDLTVVPDIDKK